MKHLTDAISDFVKLVLGGYTVAQRVSERDIPIQSFRLYLGDLRALHRMLRQHFDSIEYTLEEKVKADDFDQPEEIMELLGKRSFRELLSISSHSSDGRRIDLYDFGRWSHLSYGDNIASRGIAHELADFLRARRRFAFLPTSFARSIGIPIGSGILFAVGAIAWNFHHGIDAHPVFSDSWLFFVVGVALAFIGERFLRTKCSLYARPAGLSLGPDAWGKILVFVVGNVTTAVIGAFVTKMMGYW